MGRGFRGQHYWYDAILIPDDDTKAEIILFGGGVLETIETSRAVLHTVTYNGRQYLLKTEMK